MLRDIRKAQKEREVRCPHWMEAGDGAGIPRQARLTSNVTDDKKPEPKSRRKVHADQLCGLGCY